MNKMAKRKIVWGILTILRNKNMYERPKIEFDVTARVG